MNKHADVASLRARLTNLNVAGNYTLGVETGTGILDVGAAALKLGLPAPKDMDDLLQNGTGGQVLAVMNGVLQRPEAALYHDPATTTFAPLVTRPEKIICVGINYQKHAEETGMVIPDEPPLFSKYWNALNQHNGIIQLPTSIDYRFDYETELVVVFGRECKDVTEAKALDYIAGYATGNDFSARKMQTATTQWTAGKVSDGFAPVGPWLVPRDCIVDPNRLRLQTHVNGQKRQDSNTEDMIFTCQQLIAYVTSIMTIKPGDILFTGTPEGVIVGEKGPLHQRNWLKGGDEVSLILQLLAVQQ